MEQQDMISHSGGAASTRVGGEARQQPLKGAGVELWNGLPARRSDREGEGEIGQQSTGAVGSVITSVPAAFPEAVSAGAEGMGRSREPACLQEQRIEVPGREGPFGQVTTVLPEQRCPETGGSSARRPWSANPT